MADQKKWFKVWTSITDDPDFLDMSLEDIGRWVLLGAYTAKHGNKGTVEASQKALSILLRTDEVDEKIDVLHNVFEEVKNDNGKKSVTFKNWSKYQEDSTSYERVKKYRNMQNDNGVRGEEKRREERRGEENKDYLALSDFFLKEILAKNPHSRLHSKSKAETEKLLSGWAADFRLLVEKDKQPMELIRKVIVATTSDSFWSNKVLSGKKLREKWDTLVTLVPFVECPNVRTEKTVLEKIQESERNET